VSTRDAVEKHKTVKCFQSKGNYLPLYTGVTWMVHVYQRWRQCVCIGVVVLDS